MAHPLIALHSTTTGVPLVPGSAPMASVGYVDADTGLAKLAVGIGTFFNRDDVRGRRQVPALRHGHHLRIGPGRRVGRNRAEGRAAHRPH